MKYSEGFILGGLLSQLGLSYDDALKIATGDLKLAKTAEEIREFIKTDSKGEMTLTMKLYRLGIDMKPIMDEFKFNEEDLDDKGLWLNRICMRDKTSVATRRKLVAYLENCGITLNSIATILDVAVSTVQNDRNRMKEGDIEHLFTKLK